MLTCCAAKAQKMWIKRIASKIKEKKPSRRRRKNMGPGEIVRQFSEFSPPILVSL